MKWGKEGSNFQSVISPQTRALSTICHCRCLAETMATVTETREVFTFKPVKMESAVSVKHWWSKDTVAVVTGGNRGIGYEIVRQLAEQGMTVVLTTRDSAKGEAAVDSLKAEGLQSVVFHTLDVTSSESVEKLASWLKSKFGGLDILVNNAGVLQFTDVSFEVAKLTLDTNYYGVKKVTEGLLPLFRPSQGPRIIMVTGRSGMFERFSGESLKQKFRDEKNYTFDFVDSIASKYLEDVKGGHGPHEKDWPWIPKWRVPMYSESKILLNAYLIVLAKALSHVQREDEKICVVGFCPGSCETDMLSNLLASGYEAPIPHSEIQFNTAAQGASPGVWLATLPKEDVAQNSGKLFADFNGERAEFSFSWADPIW